MARVLLAPDLTSDFDRIVQHLAEHDVTEIGQRIDEIIAALDLLIASPQIGRPVRGQKRELLIGHGSRGYVALYEYFEVLDTVFVLAIRSQREAGYSQ